MGHLSRSRRVAAIIGIAAGALGAVNATAATAAPRTQIVDPYTGGTALPAQPCRPGTLTVVPSGVVSSGEQLTLSTEGQRPNSVATFSIAGAVVGAVTANGSGAASVIGRAPAGNVENLAVAVSGACGITSATLNPRAAVLGQEQARGGAAVAGEKARGFARTGFAMLPWVLVALVLIIVGRELARRGPNDRGRGSRHHAATRRKSPRVLVRPAAAPSAAR